MVPPELADELLPKFGAKVKRSLSPEQRLAMKQRLQAAKNLHATGFCPIKNDVPAALPDEMGHRP
jgi:hypothetical protein